MLLQQVKAAVEQEDWERVRSLTSLAFDRCVELYRVQRAPVANPQEGGNEAELMEELDYYEEHYGRNFIRSAHNFALRFG